MMLIKDEAGKVQIVCPNRKMQDATPRSMEEEEIHLAMQEKEEQQVTLH